MVDLYLRRQVFILITALFYSFSVGVMLAFPSVLNPAIVSSNSTDIRASSSQASWIAASNGFAGMLGFFILSPILQLLGRKVVHITSNAFLFIGWITLILAHNATALFAARIIQGIAIGGIYIHSMIISEYSDPKRRGCFLISKKVASAVGTLLCHALSLTWNWRQIAIFASIPSIISIILTFSWPESPSYLAMKGRFKASEEAFVWLHGGSNMYELHRLITIQEEKQKILKKEEWYKFIFKKDFLKPFAIVSILTLLLDLCGKYYFVVYIIQILQELVGDSSIAIYCSIGADVLIIIALLSSCFIIKHYKRRTILFSVGTATVILMLIISIIVVLKISSVMWFSTALILLQSFLVNIGLIPVGFAIIGEVFPLEHKGYGSCSSGIVFTLLYAVTLKLTPVLMENTGIEGLYAVYGVSIAMCLVVLYFLVPETKDRTLQDIEDEFKDVKSEMCNVTVNWRKNNGTIVEDR